MMATLVGVLIAIMLGILGLAVGIFQAWVAYQARKHPASTGERMSIKYALVYTNLYKVLLEAFAAWVLG